MLETSKATRRRNADTSFPWGDVFKGVGLDVGSGDDPLPGAMPFDLPDGGGDDLRLFFNQLGVSLDFIHGSNVMEHFIDPVLALNSWIEMLKPGGYIVATVPDFYLYEKATWPSKWNAGHRSTWRMAKYDKFPPHISQTIRKEIAINCTLPEWLEQFPVNVLRCVLVDTNFDYSLGPEVDQTYDASKGVECFCELVVKKL